MNGFETKGLNEDTFGEKSSLSGLKTFDAFRESINTSSSRNKDLPGTSSYHSKMLVLILFWSPIYPELTV